MPPLPPGLSEWFGPSFVLAGLALLLSLQGKRIDELREDMKELRAGMKEIRADLKEIRADLKASETRQQQDMKELRAELKAENADLKADNRVLAEKMDRLIEALLAVKQA